MNLRPWVRANGVALAALPVVIVATFVTADDRGLLDRWRDERRSIAEFPSGSAAVWEGTSYRVVGIGDMPADDPDLTGPIPTGTRAVRIVVEAVPPSRAPDDAHYCSVGLLDAEGRRFDLLPRDLPTTYGLDTSCNAPPEARSSPFQLRLLFLLPDDAVAHAVRLGDIARNRAVDLLVDDG